MRHLKQTLLGLTALTALGCAEGVTPPAASTVARIEGGTFVMGGADRDPCDRMAASTLECHPLIVSELVQHEVQVDTYCLDRSEVTVEQYRHCVAHGECSKPQLTNIGIQGQDNFIRRYYNEPDTFGDHPVVGVTHQQAERYCAWKGGRLPSEAEWEFAATSRGTSTTVWSEQSAINLQGRVETDCTGSRGKIALGDCASTAQPVGTAEFDQTAQGVSDMAGNIGEWVADEFDFLAYCENKEGYEVDRSKQENELRFTNGIPEAVLSDPTCVANCSEAYDGCRNACALAFDGNSPSDVARREHRARACALAFSDRASVVDATGLLFEEGDGGLVEIECDPGNPAWCTPNDAGDGETCEAFCQCLTTPLPGAEFDGTACHNACIDTFTTCTNDASCAPDAAVACNIAATRPTAWCNPRQGATGADVRVDVPPSLAFRDNQKSWVVRGGDVTNGQLCEGRPTRRQARSAAQSTVGFRCAYAPTSDRCGE